MKINPPPSIAGCGSADNRDSYRASMIEEEAARRLIPGGHHLPGRPWINGGRAPTFFTGGKGCLITDVDGRTYCDFGMALGPAVLGYADETVDAAVTAALPHGNLLTLNTPLATRFAEAVTGWVRSAEMAMPFKTGSDATTAALRIARRHTGRRRIAMAGYVGWHDWCLAGADYVPLFEPDQVMRFRANDPQTLSDIFDYAGTEVAAVILAAEEVRGASRDTFCELMELARRWGAVFILDEIKTGIRTAPGTLQDRLGIAPDMTTLSKALGNGYSIAAVVGRREVMAAADGLHVSGTFFTESVGLTAALATLDRLRDQVILERIWTLGERLIAGLDAICRSCRAPAAAAAEPLPPMPMLRFQGWPEHRLEPLRERFFEELFRRGVLCNPRHVWFVSGAHRADDVDDALNAAEDAMKSAIRATARGGGSSEGRMPGPGRNASVASAARPILRAGFVGCGPRAYCHAQAYAQVDRARIESVCDLDPERSGAFADAVGADCHVTLESLLATAPDIIEIMVPPRNRGALVEACLDAEPKILILEKPVALDVDDLRQLQRLIAGRRTVVVANTQLRFHPSAARLIAAVSAGEIGDPRLIEASAFLPIAEQGPHLIDLAAALTAGSPVASVFGHACGVEGLSASHPSPDCVIADIAYASGVRLHLACGRNARTISGDQRAHRHKAVAVHGTRGFASWSMHRWELSTADGYDSGAIDYAGEDIAAQAALLNAAIDSWEKGDGLHPTRISSAISQWEIALAIYASSLAETPIELPLLGKLDSDLLPRLLRREFATSALA